MPALQPPRWRRYKPLKVEENTTKKTSLKAQSAWLLFAKLVGFVFAFLLPLLVVRFLDKESVGVYRQSFQLIANLTMLLSLGFAMSAYYFLSREAEKRAPAMINILLFHFVTGGAACLTLFFFPNIIGNIFQSAEMTRLAPAIGAVIWVWIFSTFLEIAAVANREARLATAFIIFAQFSKTAFLVGAVILYQTVEAIIYAAIFQGAVQTVILLIYLNSRFPRFWQKFDFRFFWEHLVYALPFGFAGVLWMLQADVHTYFVGYRFSDAEYAIYAIGCFQLPLVSMLFEAVTSVLIPRMSELEMQNDRKEMIRLTARAMQKLALFCLPIYVFLLITAEVFVITMFTREYAASIPIFLINLTLLPLHIWMVDPIIRAYKELGGFLLKLRLFTFIILLAALYFGIQYFDLRGMIAIVVVSALFEKFVAETIIIRRLGVKSEDLYLLKDIGKTAIVSLAAGIITFFVYHYIKEIMPPVGENLARMIFAAPKQNAADFIAGSLTLLISFAVYAPIYLFGISFWNVIDEEEKETIRNIIGKILRKSNNEMPEKKSFFTT